MIPLRVPMLFGAGVLLAPLAPAQVFSVDWHSAIRGTPDSFLNQAISEGDLLSPADLVPDLGPLPPPGTLIPSGQFGLGLMTLPNCLTFGGPCGNEVDALSFGDDYRFDLLTNLPPPQVWISVDEYAVGVPQPFFVGPTLQSEAPHGDSSADLFVNRKPLFLPPIGPPAVPGSAIGAIDGDGLAGASGFQYPGVGLIEPNPPTAAPPPDPGDNIDAVDFEGPPIAINPRTFFSLDASYVDPLTGIPNSGSAAFHGATGADIFVKAHLVFSPVVWAHAQDLGLNLIAAAPDDLDALAIHDNLNNLFEPSQQPLDWLTGATDMVLFSVRRGSGVIGQPDSIFGLPIEEGDILTTPLDPLHGGLSPFPGIFIAAEFLGVRTNRSDGVPFGDDVNALDVLGSAFFDCNNNLIEDAVDIATGTSNDFNLNGIPDECEAVVTEFCFCDSISPCGNLDPNGGCANSTGTGSVASWSGSTSVSQDDLVLTASNVPPFQFGIFFMGDQNIGALFFADGLRCVGGPLFRFPVHNSGNSGTLSEGPGIIAHSQTSFPPAGHIAVGQTWNFQCWYRDPAGPCLNTANASNALAVTFVP